MSDNMLENLDSQSSVYGSTSVSLDTRIYDKNKEILEQVESKSFLDEEIKRAERFIPNINFKKPENFVKYGSAEKYYSDSIKRIYQTYPFDGSRKEVAEWYNKSSYLDLYMFENLYPRNVGYLSLNSWMHPTASVNPNMYQSINFSGYSNADDTYTNPYHVIEMDDSQANIIDDLRGNNAKYTSSEGLTLEYWVKCDSKDTIESMLSSNDFPTGSELPLTVVNLYTKEEDTNIIFSSGFNCVKNSSSDYEWSLSFDIQDSSYNSYFGSDQPTKEIKIIEEPQEWMHVAVSIDSDLTRIYLNGKLIKGLNYANGPAPDCPVLHGNIGSLMMPSSGEFIISSPTGFSIDEFRLWNKTRKESQIKKYWWDQVGGGTNTDDANVSLGVYYKFNEGIFGDTSYDENVLDYSGRQTDSTILNYTSGTRKNDSSPLPSEFKDPVIYPEHPDVLSLSAEYEKIGKYHDQKNGSKLYNMIPSWIVEDDERQDSEVLKNMIQIMSSYLDTLFLQIEKLPEVVGSKEEYLYDPDNTESMTKSMLENRGFIVPDLFADASLTEKFQHRTEKEHLEKELSVVKNLIYKNIYNNSSTILKSKGTEKSLRNLFRCFGVDEELLKTRVYPVNQKIELDKQRSYSSSIKKRYADFSSTENHRAGTLFSYAIDDSIGVITGSDSDDSLDMSSITFECEAYFPKRFTLAGKDLSYSNVLTSSIAGISSVYSDDDPSDTTQDENQAGNFKIRFIKDSYDSSTGYFSVMFPSGTFGELTSSKFDVYDNERWNLSVRIGEKSKYSDFMTGSTQDYQVSFSGYNYDSTNLSNSFILNKDIETEEAVVTLTTSKRVFAGADVTNHTGSTASTLSDTMISSVRYWLDWLPDDVLNNHALYPLSIGNNPLDNAYYYDSGISGDDLSGKQINKMDLLVLNWDLSKIDEIGNNYYTYDRSKSLPTSNSLINQKTVNKYSGKFHYSAGTVDGIKNISKVKQIVGARPNEVDYIKDSDLVNIKENETEVFKVNADPIYNRVSVEKSYAAVINDEIMKYFSGMSYFSNLIGRPVNKYRVNYKEIDFFRRKLFNLFNPDNEAGKDPDIEKFLEYYKWIDESINIFVGQMLPASQAMSPSSVSSNNILNVIESHLLERSKYQHKYPIIGNKKDKRVENIEARARFSFDRIDVPNPETSPQPALRYYRFTDTKGNTRVFISNATIEYRTSPTGVIQTATAEEVRTKVLDPNQDVYFDF